MAKKQKFDFLYFDIGKTLFNYDNSIERISSKLGMDPIVCQKLWEIANPEMYLGHMTMATFEKSLTAVSKYKGPDFDFMGLWMEGYTCFPGMYQLLVELTAHYRMGVISNLYDGQFKKAEEMDLLPVINWDARIFSHAALIAKPDTLLFEIAEIRARIKTKTDLSPNRILLVDDTLQNIRAAQNRGWQVYLFNPDYPDACASELKEMLLP